MSVTLMRIKGFTGALVRCLAIPADFFFQTTRRAHDRQSPEDGPARRSNRTNRAVPVVCAHPACYVRRIHATYPITTRTCP